MSIMSFQLIRNVKTLMRSFIPFLSFQVLKIRVYFTLTVHLSLD